MYDLSPILYTLLVISSHNKSLLSAFGFCFNLMIDVNECDREDVCDHECRNTYGSYHCVCRDGYQIADDSRTCHGNYANIYIYDHYAIIHGKHATVYICSNYVNLDMIIMQLYMVTMQMYLYIYKLYVVTMYSYI